MNREIMYRWVAYLEDGTRIQGTGELRGATGAQCCLDVLCEIAVEDGIIDPPTQEFPEEEYWYRGVFDDDTPDFRHEWSETSVLPEVVWKWAGLEESNPYVIVPVSFIEEYGLNEEEFSQEYWESGTYGEDDYEDGYKPVDTLKDLAACNDDLHLPFEAIAKCIKATL